MNFYFFVIHIREIGEIMEHSVVFEKVTKQYKMQETTLDKIKYLFNIHSKKREKVHYALKDVSFTVEKGDVIGVIGKNGSGKSTLSNLIIGATSCTEGNVQVNGQASLIAISSGLNNNLTGLENIELKALMMGMSKQRIKEIKQEVIDFSELGKFINQPVKSYSSGMKSRLGFAISLNINPDILVVDEALSVGDETFYQKCIDKFDEFKAQGKTIFYVSHSLRQIENFCEKTMWINEGTLKSFGPTKEVIEEYKQYLNTFKKK